MWTGLGEPRMGMWPFVGGVSGLGNASGVARSTSCFVLCPRTNFHAEPEMSVPHPHSHSFATGSP